MFAFSEGRIAADHEIPTGARMAHPEKQHAAGSGARLLRVGEEQDLTIDLVVANGVLAVR